MQDKDSQLAARALEFAGKSREAGQWIADNAAQVGSETAALQKEMRHSARFFAKCANAARRKMCVGVFGPSQSGKSYLISTLARDAKGTLLADFGGTRHDFITSINPEGGRESTGLVTRFTTTPPAGLPDGFPIRLRLLSELDVARVIANTYYADCEHKQAPDADALAAGLDRLEKVAATSPADAGTRIGRMGADEIEELRDYLNRNFISRPRVQLLQHGYWQRAAAMVSSLGLEDRASLVGLVWNGTARFQQLYLRLCSALAALGNPDEAYCPINALIPRETSIIDVRMLDGLMNEDPDEQYLPILGAGGKRADLPRAVVTALTAEITVYMPEKPDDFFEHTDLLDFPGYRSRLHIEDLERELEKDSDEDGENRGSKLATLFLRGKVAYLFERYCEEKELTSMLLCIGPSNQDVQELPRAVYDWICSTHGEIPANRAGRPPALFFVLTKMDMEFEKKKGSASVESRWTTRMQTSLLDFFGKLHDWPENWDGRQPFNNVYLLRNPNVRCEAIFSYDGNEQESGIQPGQLAFVDEVHRAFVQSPLVIRHVADPERVWQAAMSLNDGGVALLREKLRPLCNPELKRRQIEVALAEKTAQVQSRLAPFYKTDDREELRRQHEQLSRQMVGMLAQVAEKQLFGEFLGALQVNDFELFELCSREPAGKADEPESSLAAPVVGARVSANDILGDIFGDSAGLATDSPGRPYQADQPGQAAPRDSSAVLAGRVVEYWIERLADLAADPARRNRFGLGARELDQFCHQLVISARRCRMREELENDLRKASAFSNLARERLVWKQVTLAANAINSFVNWLGFDPRHKDNAGRSILFAGKKTVLFAPPPRMEGEPRIGEQEYPYDRARYTDWLRALAWSIMANVDHGDGQEIDIEQNNRLRAILQAFGQ